MSTKSQSASDSTETKHTITISEDDKPYFDALARAIENDYGNCSPAENFLTNLLLAYGFRGNISVADVERALETFREDMHTLVEHAKRLRERYPELFREPARTASALADLQVPDWKN